MRAYVLCGGFGTRLRGVIQDSQKALVNVHGQPFLRRVLQQLQLAGITEVVLCAHYRADQLAEQLVTLTRDASLTLDMVVEAQPMGTGGALLHALQARPAAGRYLVLNADTYLEPEAYRLALQSDRNVLVAVRVEDRSRYGSLSVDDCGRLLSLQEKGLAGAGLINAGVYGFTIGALDGCMPRPCSMESDLLPYLLQHGGVHAREYAGPFIDIGTPDSLIRYASDFPIDMPR